MELELDEVAGSQLFASYRICAMFADPWHNLRYIISDRMRVYIRNRLTLVRSYTVPSFVQTGRSSKGLSERAQQLKGSYR